MVICRVEVQVAGSAGRWTTLVGREYDEYDVHKTNQGPQRPAQQHPPYGVVAAHFRPLRGSRDSRQGRPGPCTPTGSSNPRLVCTDLSIMLLTDHLKLAWRCERGLILQSRRMQHCSTPMGQAVVEPRVPTRSIGCPNGLTPDRTLGRSRNSVPRLSAITSFVWNDG